MIERKTLARPYAKAVFELATENNNTQTWTEVLRILEQIVKDERVLKLLTDTRINTETLSGFLGEVLQASIKKTALGKSLDNKWVENFLSILAYRKRLEILPEIRHLYEEYLQAAEHRIDVQLHAPIALDLSQKAKYQEMFEKYFSRTVNLQCSIDNSLLGGFIARAGNFVMDASVRGNLFKLKQELTD
jgi:F-type H+-transporting ATPase subunit delta